VDGDRLEVAAEGLAHGDHAGDPVRRAQAGDHPREPGGEGPAVGHDVGDAGSRPAQVRGTTAHAGDHRRHGRVQVGHHHGEAGEVVRVSEHLVPGGLLLVDAEQHRLEGRVPGLDDVTGTGRRVGRQPVREGGDQPVPPGAESAGERRDGDAHAVADLGLAHQRHVGERADHGPGRQRPISGRRVLPAAQDLHTEFLRAVPGPALGSDHGISPHDHAGHATAEAGAEAAGSLTGWRSAWTRPSGCSTSSSRSRTPNGG